MELSSDDFYTRIAQAMGCERDLVKRILYMAAFQPSPRKQISDPEQYTEFQSVNVSVQERVGNCFIYGHVFNKIDENDPDRLGCNVCGTQVKLP